MVPQASPTHWKDPHTGFVNFLGVMKYNELTGDFIETLGIRERDELQEYLEY